MHVCAQCSSPFTFYFSFLPFNPSDVATDRWSWRKTLVCVFFWSVSANETQTVTRPPVPTPRGFPMCPTTPRWPLWNHRRVCLHAGCLLLGHFLPMKKSCRDGLVDVSNAAAFQPGSQIPVPCVKMTRTIVAAENETAPVEKWQCPMIVSASRSTSTGSSLEEFLHKDRKSNGSKGNQIDICMMMSILVSN